MYVGLENALDLPQASTLCNQCGVVCPVKIPLPDLQRKLREKEFERRLRPWYERAGAADMGVVRARARALYGVATAHRHSRAAHARRSQRHDPQAAARQRLDRRARHAGARGPHVPRALRRARSERATACEPTGATR